MRLLNKALFFILVLQMLSGCFLTRREVEEVENKKVMQDQVVHLQKNTADQQLRFSEINQDLREMNGKIDSIENSVKSSDNSHQKTHTFLENQLAESNKRIMALQQEIEKLNGQVNALVQTLQQQATAPASAQVKKADGSTPKNSYELAEILFSKKEFAEAAQNYEKYRAKFPKGKSYLDATMKLGICFQELDQLDEAKEFYKEVIELDSKSPQAKAAKVRLKKIK